MAESAKIRPVSIELDRPRQLIVDLNALDLAEQKTGLNLLNPQAWFGLRAGHLKFLVWAFLLRDDPKLEPEAVGAFLHPGNVRQVMTALTEAVRASMPVSDAEEEEEEDDEENAGSPFGP